ncbi:hypothetical protein ACIP86_27395 [Pseudomonas neuropathica]
MNDIQSESGIEAVLYPPKLVAGTYPVIVDPPPGPGIPVQGAPQSIFTEELLTKDGSKEGAAKLVVDPPSESYASIALYMQGPRDAEFKFIEKKPAPTDSSQPTEFLLAQTLLNDGVHKVLYVLERGSGNSAPSTELWVVHHDDLPGGNDVVPATGDHPGLGISLPPAPQIGKDEADKGVDVTVSYEFMNWLDKILLEIGRERFEFLVQKGEQGFPKKLHVTRKMLELAGDNPKLPFAYTVVSQINNPTHKRRWSKTLTVDVDVNRVVLPALILSEVENDESDRNVINLDNVVDFIFAQLFASEPQWQPGDIVRLGYECTKSDGTKATHSDEIKLANLPFFATFKVPVEKVLLGGEIKAGYSQIRSEVIATSKPAVAQVTGMPRHGYESWEGVPLQTFSVNSPRTFPSGLTFTLLSQGAPTLLVQNAPIAGHHLQFGAKSRGRFSWNADMKHLEFLHFHIEYPGSLILFYGANGALVSSQALPTSTSSGVPQKFVHHSNIPFRWFEVDSVGEIGSTGFHIDEIRWTWN